MFHLLPGEEASHPFNCASRWQLPRLAITSWSLFNRFENILMKCPAEEWDLCATKQRSVNDIVDSVLGWKCIICNPLILLTAIFALCKVYLSVVCQSEAYCLVLLDRGRIAVDKNVDYTRITFKSNYTIWHNNVTDLFTATRLPIYDALMRLWMVLRWDLFKRYLRDTYLIGFKIEWKYFATSSSI